MKIKVEDKKRSKQSDIDKLLKREYLRGIIDGQTTRLFIRYTLQELDEIYKKYTEANPTFRKL